MQAAFAEMVHEAEERDVLRRNEPSLACWTAHTGERPRYLAAYDDTLMGYGKYIFPICAANCTFCQTFFTACAFWTIRYLRKNRDARSEKSRRMHLQFVWLLLLQVSQLRVTFWGTITCSSTTFSSELAKDLFCNGMALRIFPLEKQHY